VTFSDSSLLVLAKYALFPATVTQFYKGQEYYVESKVRTSQVQQNEE